MELHKSSVFLLLSTHFKSVVPSSESIILIQGVVKRSLSELKPFSEAFLRRKVPKIYNKLVL